MTMRTIAQKCSEFKVGDRVNIVRKIKGTGITPPSIKKTKVTVIGKYDTYLLTTTDKGIRECFNYSDILINGVIEKGRK